MTVPDENLFSQSNRLKASDKDAWGIVSNTPLLSSSTHQGNKDEERQRLPWTGGGKGEKADS